MQAIETKYHGATNYRGSRVSARCQAGRIMLSWDDALGTEGNHDAAAVALVRKLKWNPARLVSGGLPSGRGNVYVLAIAYGRRGVTPTVNVK